MRNKVGVCCPFFCSDNLKPSMPADPDALPIRQKGFVFHLVHLLAERTHDIVAGLQDFPHDTLPGFSLGNIP